jgi:Xaa-Pro aminopeptidase
MTNEIASQDPAGLLEQRLSKFRQVLAKRELDAILIANYAYVGGHGFDYNLFYLTNLYHRYDNSFLILTENDCYLCVDVFEAARAREESWLEDVHEAPIMGFPAAACAKVIAQALKETVAKPFPRVGVNGKKLCAGVALGLIYEAQLLDVSLDIQDSLVVRDALEIELFAQAGRIAHDAAQALTASVREGMTEWELTALLEYEMKRRGANAFWYYPTIVGSGPEHVSPMGGASPTDRKVVRGDIIHIDLCPSYRGYNADIARTMVLGSPTPQQLEAMETVYTAFERGVEALRAGNTVGNLREAVLSPLQGSAYRAFIGGSGHGMGFNDDCYPSFTPRERVTNFVFRDGMAASVEVYAAIPGLGGIQYEDNFIVNGSRPIRLTEVEKLVIVEV